MGRQRLGAKDEYHENRRRQEEKKAQDAEFITPEFCDYYSQHALEFVEDIIMKDLRVIRPELVITDDIRNFLEALNDPRRRIAWRAGHSVGKTAALGCAILWFMITRSLAYPKPIVMVTGPKFDQLKITIWAEIRRWIIHTPLESYLTWSSEKITLTDSPQDGWAEMRTAKKGEGMAGVHNKHLMWVADEGSGIDDARFEVITGSLTGDDNYFITAGNPTQIRGFFFDCFGKNADLFKTLHSNSENSPIVPKSWLIMMARKWHKDSDIYRVRVRGDFPKGNPRALISLADIEAAMNREVDKGDFLEFGLDTARMGTNLTCGTVRQGYHVYPQETMAQATEPEVVRFMADMIKKYRQKTGIKSLAKVKVDAGGLPGVVDYLNLQAQALNIEVVECNFGGAGNENYSNNTGVMWGDLRAVIGLISLPDDDDLRGELSSRRQEPGLDAKGRIIIESKEKFKKDYGQSPDRADSMVLCFSGSQEKKRVFKTFDFRLQEHVQEFDVMQKHSFTNKFYVSMFESKDLSVYALLCAWHPVKRRLLIFNEFKLNMPRPDVAILALSEKAKESMETVDQIKFQWYGNASMFGSSGGATADLFLTSGVLVMENIWYDDYGSIAKTIQMFASNQIMIHSRCTDAIKQLYTWTVVKDRPEGIGRSGNPPGYCMALSNIVALCQKETLIENKVVPQEYTKEVGRTEKNMQDRLTAWMKK